MYIVYNTENLKIVCYFQKCKQIVNYCISTVNKLISLFKCKMEFC